MKKNLFHTKAIQLDQNQLFFIFIKISEKYHYL